MNIGVIGTGYVGLVAGVAFADAGHNVVCQDSQEEKILSLQKGQVPFYEPGLEDLFTINKARMTFTHNLAEAVDKSDILFIAVGTPERPDGSADLEPTFHVLKSICEAATHPKIVVLKSTVPVGTSRRVKSFVHENAKTSLVIVSNPEFLRQGAALEDFLKPDRVVIGCDEPEAMAAMEKVYRPFLKDGQPILFMDNTSAEMTKYAANSFLAIKISFINELALLADKVGADIESVRAGFTSDSRIHPAFFNPGIGYGGSCFPKDVRALIHTGKENNIDLKLLHAADEVNERQKVILTNRLFERLGTVKGKRVGVWGLSFKPRTDDVRRAPSLKIIEELFLNGALVKAYDPVASDNAKLACRVPFEVTESALDAAVDADALLIVTEWSEFQGVDLKTLKSRMKVPLIFDGRNLFDPARMSDEGFEYYGIGRQVRT